MQKQENYQYFLVEKNLELYGEIHFYHEFISFVKILLFFKCQGGPNHTQEQTGKFGRNLQYLPW